MIVYEDTKEAYRITALCAVNLNGHFLVRFIKGACTTLIYSEFLEKLGIVNEKQSIFAIEDNAAIHHSAISRIAANKANITNIFTPPYSPQYNFIEYDFATNKSRLYNCDTGNYNILTRIVVHIMNNLPSDMQLRLFLKSLRELAHEA